MIHGNSKTFYSKTRHKVKKKIQYTNKAVAVMDEDDDNDNKKDIRGNVITVDFSNSSRRCC